MSRFLLLSVLRVRAFLSIQSLLSFAKRITTSVTILQKQTLLFRLLFLAISNDDIPRFERRLITTYHTASFSKPIISNSFQVDPEPDLRYTLLFYFSTNQQTTSFRRLQSPEVNIDGGIERRKTFKRILYI